MVVQVKEKVLVLDQPFLQPDAVRRVKVLEGLDGVHRSAFHLTHGHQPIRPRIGFRSQPLARALDHRWGGTRIPGLEVQSRRLDQSVFRECCVTGSAPADAQ